MHEMTKEKSFDNANTIPVSILHKSIAGRYRSVRVADGSIEARCRFIKNASWDMILGPEVIKLFSCSTQLSMEFSLLIHMKMPTMFGIFILISREIFMLSYV